MTETATVVEAKTAREGAALVGLLNGLEIWLREMSDRGTRLTPEVHSEARKRLAELHGYIDGMLES